MVLVFFRPNDLHVPQATASITALGSKRYRQNKMQDHQAFIKAKYCPRVAAAAGTQKNNTQNPCDLDRWSMTFKLNRVVEVVKVHVHAKYDQAMCRGS